MNLSEAPTRRTASSRRIHLASRSPRRQQLLREHGLEFEARHPGFEDSDLQPGRVTPPQWVAALAYLKAAAGLAQLPATARDEAPPIVLGADTACVQGDRLIGTPRNADEAREMIRALRDGAHDVITGVALIEPASGRRLLFADTARVEVGHLSDAQIEEYILSGDWRGKAGAYNLSERLAAGWPIRYTGDPATVMGLPVRRLLRLLDRWPPGGADPRGAAA
ncbi:MAG: septum formation protein Maf [Phycisphaerales bacterium]|nr:septum formation protein Maf [Phycisphaerales bacterium]